MLGRIGVLVVVVAVLGATVWFVGVDAVETFIAVNWNSLRGLK